MPRHRRARLLSLSALIALAAACGSSTSETTPEPTTVISITPTSFALLSGGQTTTLTATVTSGGTTELTPTIQWTSDNVAVATVSGAVRDAVVTSVAAGTALITARIGSATATSVVVVNPAPVPTITLSTGPVTLAPGGTGAFVVVVSRNAFTAPVTLELVNPPAGVTGTFGAANPTFGGETRLLTLSVGPQVASGTYTMTLRGTGTGIADATTTFVLTVS